MSTPIGVLEIQASEHGITKLIFLESGNNTINSCGIINQCKQQLKEYFYGKRKEFDLPLDQHGTNFQKSVWAQLVKVLFGQIASYRDIVVLPTKSRHHLGTHFVIIIFILNRAYIAIR